MARSTGPAGGARKRTSAQRQEAASTRLRTAARRGSPGAARRAKGLPEPSAVLTRAHRGDRPRIRPTGMLLRFIACGILSVAAGLAWKLTLAPSRLGLGSTLLGILVLLSGFLVGGLLWYWHDARRRSRDPRAVPDDQLVFSFVVFAIVPLLVLLLVLAVYVVALVVGFA